MCQKVKARIYQITVNACGQNDLKEYFKRTGDTQTRGHKVVIGPHIRGLLVTNACYRRNARCETHT